MPHVESRELTGTPLDWAVAKAIGCEFKENSIGALHAYLNGTYIGGFITHKPRQTIFPDSLYTPTNYWRQGGPLIESHIIEIDKYGGRDGIEEGWTVRSINRFTVRSGPTLLVASMRCIAGEVYPLSIEIPEGLV